MNSIGLTILLLLILAAASFSWRTIRARAPETQIGPAAQLTPSWRGNPFQVGQRYRVLAALPPPSSQDLAPGETVIYQGSGYSRYDGASIHYFLTESGETREWWLSDKDEADQSLTLFRAQSDRSS